MKNQVAKTLNLVTPMQDEYHRHNFDESRQQPRFRDTSKSRPFFTDEILQSYRHGHITMADLNGFYVCISTVICPCWSREPTKPATAYFFPMSAYTSVDQLINYCHKDSTFSVQHNLSLRHPEFVHNANQRYTKGEGGQISRSNSNLFTH